MIPGIYWFLIESVIQSGLFSPLIQTVFWLHSGKEIICSNNIQHIKEALPGVLGNRGIRPFISGEQGNKGLKLKGTGEQRQFWGIGNIENQDFDFGEQGKMTIFFRGTREQVPSLGGPHQNYMSRVPPSS